MSYIPPEVVQEAKRMDLLTYLQNYDPNELVKICRGTYCTREHDSLKISNGKWFWFSKGIGGRSALDYLIKVKGFSFTDAVMQISGQAVISPPVFAYQKAKPKVKKIQLPRANINNLQVISYLVEQRGISRRLVDFCIETGRLYESLPHHNAVFVGLDHKHEPRFATQRGIHSDFKCEVSGSDKRFSFSISESKTADTIHVFESPIDLLSYATLQNYSRKDLMLVNLLSLAGIIQPKKKLEESTLPIALKQYLLNHPHIKKIVFHLDNDIPGRLSTRAIMAVLPEEYEVSDCPPPLGEDYNDSLLRFIKKQK